MTDAERQALTPGQVVYYLDDQGEYHRLAVTTSPWQVDLGKWVIGLCNTGSVNLNRVIGRDLADCEAHRFMQIHKSEIVTYDPEQFADDIADAIRAGEQWGAAK